MQSFIKQIKSAGKPMAVICHAPRGLVPGGRILTSYHTLQVDLRNAGATWVDREVAMHGNLVTSRQPGGIPAFTREMLNLSPRLEGRDGNFPCDSRCCRDPCRCISWDLLGAGRGRVYLVFPLNAGGQLSVSIQAHSDCDCNDGSRQRSYATYSRLLSYL